MPKMHAQTYAHMHMHTHTHNVQTHRGEGQCCLTEKFREEKCLQFAFQGRESSRFSFGVCACICVCVREILRSSINHVCQCVCDTVFHRFVYYNKLQMYYYWKKKNKV